MRKQMSFARKFLMPVSLVMASGVVAAHGSSHTMHKKAEVISRQERSFGKQGDPKEAMKTVRVEMGDNMRFTPSSLNISQGETVRFVVTNRGLAMHEMVLGTMAELKEHGELMKRFPEMEHDEPYMAHVAPGKTEVIVWKFTKAGQFNFGCLVPGHFESGMVGSIIVKEKKS
jgi:uncharacterized cupredoxin-like copper-binding protein